ncbi:hypothetical protein [Isoptericola sp. NPDC057653]|uniref:hypothetical protein n=1 Tax=Isoptericola sp. NPDC057653 TaxID=3346195 RepID=UPI00368DCD69
MSLTRRTPRFAALAEITELELAWRGLPAPSDLVDAALNAHVESVANELQLRPDRALSYAPDELGTIIAETLVEVVLEDLQGGEES